jgi:IS5 family transposase
VGVDLGIASAPEETTIPRFRHLLEKHDLGGLMLDAVNVLLDAKGIKIQTGAIVDARMSTRLLQCQEIHALHRGSLDRRSWHQVDVLSNCHICLIRMTAHGGSAILM